MTFPNILRKSILAFVLGAFCLGFIAITPSMATSTAGGTYQISGGYRFTCAIESPGTVKCWGKNSDGQLGRGTTSVSESIGAVSGITDATAITTGFGFACAIVGTGSIKCWGNGASGALGNGSTANSSTPVDVLGISNAVSIESGGESVCALLADGSIKCWGYNGEGELGTGSLTPGTSSTPVTVTGGRTYTALSSGGYSACGLATDGKPYCWGWNDNGQLGTGSASPSSVPTPTADVVVTNPKSVAFGERHICYLKSNDEVICRGYGYYGEMGNGTAFSFGNITPQYPQASDGTHIQNVSALASSWYTTCALKNDTTVWCWGNNDSKQRGSTTVDYYPNQVTSLSNVVALTGGWQHECAVIVDGSVKCWGRDADNELGDGLATASAIPVTVAGLTVMRTSSSATSRTVNFDANGGSGAMNSQTASSPTALNANTFVYPGYTFAGWKTGRSSGTSYADGEQFPFTADTTLYAQWTAIASSSPTPEPAAVTAGNSNSGSTTGTTSSGANKKSLAATGADTGDLARQAFIGFLLLRLGLALFRPAIFGRI